MLYFLIFSLRNEQNSTFVFYFALYFLPYTKLFIPMNIFNQKLFITMNILLIFASQIIKKHGRAERNIQKQD